MGDKNIHYCPPRSFYGVLLSDGGFQTAQDVNKSFEQDEDFCQIMHNVPIVTVSLGCFSQQRHHRRCGILPMILASILPCHLPDEGSGMCSNNNSNSYSDNS